MKQKITIALSVILILAAVYLIAQDLFRHKPVPAEVSCCGDDLVSLKKIDTAAIGYEKIKVIETNAMALAGIAVNNWNEIFITGKGKVIRFDASGTKSDEFDFDSLASCLSVTDEIIIAGAGPDIIGYDLNNRTILFRKRNQADSQITSVAINEGYVYAADASRRIIMKYDLTGNFIKEIGKKDTVTEAPGFIVPSPYFDLAFGGFNDLWVSNTGRLKVEQYSEDGYFQTDWGKASYEPNGFTGCCNPAHLALLPDGCFVTYEKGIDQVKLFNQAGQFICFVAGAGSFRGNADFNLGNNHLVKDLATGPDGNIYILDAYNRINVFQKKPDKSAGL